MGGVVGLVVCVRSMTILSLGVGGGWVRSRIRFVRAPARAARGLRWQVVRGRGWRRVAWRRWVPSPTRGRGCGRLERPHCRAAARRGRARSRGRGGRGVDCRRRGSGTAHHGRRASARASPGRRFGQDAEPFARKLLADAGDGVVEFQVDGGGDGVGGGSSWRISSSPLQVCICEVVYRCSRVEEKSNASTPPTA